MVDICLIIRKYHLFPLCIMNKNEENLHITLKNQ